MTIDEVRKRLEDYGYVFASAMLISSRLAFPFQILKSPRNDHHRKPFRSHSDMRRMVKDEEKIMRRRRSERIENILGYDNL